jgi:hypothetical protein
MTWTFPSTAIRPFFYPVMLNISRSFAGIYGIWFYQFLLWIMANVLLYLAIREATKTIIVPIIGVLLFAGNMTLILLTLHALTEVTSIFLLSILALIITHKHKLKYYSYRMIFVVSLLTATKPLFAALLYAMLIYKMIRIIPRIRDCRHFFKQLCFVVAAISPVLVQISIMKAKHDQFALSNISTVTVKAYILPRIYGQIERMSFKEAQKHVSSFSRREIGRYALKHYKESMHMYYALVKSNMQSVSNFTNYPRKNVSLSAYQMKANKYSYNLHLIMAPLLAITMVLLCINKKYGDLEIMVCLIAPMLVIILSSGISFGQGDRLVLPILPLWVVLYPITIQRLYNIVMRLLPIPSAGNG